MDFQDYKDAVEFKRLWAKFALMPPQVYDEEQAEDEASRIGWYFDVVDGAVFLYNTGGEELGKGETKKDVINKVMEATPGRQYTPPWERKIEYGNKIGYADKS